MLHMLWNRTCLNSVVANGLCVVTEWWISTYSLYHHTNVLNKTRPDFQNKHWVQITHKKVITANTFHYWSFFHIKCTGLQNSSRVMLIAFSLPVHKTESDEVIKCSFLISFWCLNPLKSLHNFHTIVFNLYNKIWF